MLKYQEEVSDNAKHPRNKGKLEDATHKGKATNASCGDEMVVELRVEDGKIKQVSFDGTGCALAVSAASMLTEKIEGIPVEKIKGEAERLILDFEKEVSPGRVKCVRLSLEALMQALDGEV